MSHPYQVHSIHPKFSPSLRVATGCAGSGQFLLRRGNCPSPEAREAFCLLGLVPVLRSPDHHPENPIGRTVCDTTRSMSAARPSLRRAVCRIDPASIHDPYGCVLTSGALCVKEQFHVSDRDALLASVDPILKDRAAIIASSGQ